MSALDLGIDCRVVLPTRGGGTNHVHTVRDKKNLKIVDCGDEMGK